MQLQIQLNAICDPKLWWRLAETDGRRSAARPLRCEARPDQNRGVIRDSRWSISWRIDQSLCGLIRPIGMVDFVATWQVRDAKTRLSEVIERARTEGPQTITRHGTARAVVLSIEKYRALLANKPDFKAYLLGGPKVDEFPIARDQDTGRAVDL